jgi:UDP-glucuronate decarboxylase
LTSIIGTRNVCELARRTGARVVFASTSEVYGDPLEHPQRECYRGNVNITGPRACYDEGKRAADTICADYHRRYDVDVRIARIFNTYGPRMSFQDGRVVSNFICEAMRSPDEPLTVYGDGTQTRSFCYVGDLINGLTKLMNSENPSVIASPINIGNPNEVSIFDLATHVYKLVNPTCSVPPRIDLRPLPQDDPVRRCPDISKAKNLLGWEPLVSLKEGLELTIADFKSRVERDPTLLMVDVVHQTVGS